MVLLLFTGAGRFGDSRGGLVSESACFGELAAKSGGRIMKGWAGDWGKELG